MFESRHHPLLPRRQFISRMMYSALAGLGIILVSLAFGMAGYHWYEDLSWLDAFADAAMILSGMGPLGPLRTSAGKLFAGCFALYSGLALISVAGVVLAPLVHRFLHRFHIEEK